MKFHDISVALSNATAVYPGDPQVRIGRGPKPSVSRISMGTHSGTHIDAPKHAFGPARGRGIESYSLAQFIGTCRVLDCTTVKSGITEADLARFRIKRGERILFKTKNSKKGFHKFFPDYVHLASSGAVFLAKRQVSLVGIDAWSVKQRGNTDNTPHTALLKNNIAILETIDLSKVKPGKYFLMAMPLRIEGKDGAPARAVLMDV